ncbi:MAG: hypothetical protein M3552_16270 [Planctomycetota bacterium]|nr:hypothetical protein [Planctomycetaceae bacterium]MDQ3332183.1 hypothetical protein [Planctomycetota bacterium]
MFRKLKLYVTGLAPGLLAATAFGQTVIVEPVPNTDPPRTSIEDTRERYRASRAADKPIAETPADVVEVGEGAPARQIEPADPSLDPSSDHLARPGAPQDATLLRPVLPAGYDRIELAEPVRAELLVIVKDYDGRIRDVLRRFNKVHSQTIGLEAAALAELERNGETIIAETPAGERTSGFRPGDAPAVERPADVIAAIPADSPYAAGSAEAWKTLHALHLKAVRLQAEKLVALERGLSPGQVEILRTYRVQPRTVPAEGIVIPARPAATIPGERIRQKVEVEGDKIEIEEKRVTPDGERIEIETEIPRSGDE